MGYKQAKGIIPWKEGDELPEDTIARLRGRLNWRCVCGALSEDGEMVCWHCGEEREFCMTASQARAVARKLNKLEVENRGQTDGMCWQPLRERRYLCQCKQDYCDSTMLITDEEYLNIILQGLLIITNGCEHSLEPTDVLVEECEGYKLYKEANDD